MQQIKPSQYIRLQKKICNANVIFTIHKLAVEWGITPSEACYRIINETAMREYYRRINDKKEEK